MLRRSLLAATLALAACAVDQPKEYVKVDPAYDRYASSLDVDVDRMRKLPSGLYIQDTSFGAGPVAAPGSVVDVQYTGWLSDGTKFDSSLDAGQPISFRLGAGQVIRGWDEGIEGMRVGGKRRLLIPSDLAYGTRGAQGVIPPNANLIFDVELVGVRQ
jgi:peptidylprolyl isomerase/FKBP-type peptidyl-prolyl cis-trans isomerase FkpA